MVRGTEIIGAACAVYSYLSVTLFFDYPSRKSMDDKLSWKFETGQTFLRFRFDLLLIEDFPRCEFQEPHLEYLLLN